MRWRQDNPTEVEPVPVREEEEIALSVGPRPSSSPHVEKLNLLWDERWFIFKMTIWGAVCAAVLSLVIPKRYDSTARLMPPDSTNEALALIADRTGGFGNLASNLLGIRTSSDLMVGILTSSTLQDRVITRHHLDKVYGISYPEDVRARLADNTALGLDRKSGIITITVSDRQAQRASDIANSYVKELNDLVSQLATSSARREREFLEERLHQVSQELSQAEKELSQFSSKNATLNPQDQARAMVGAVAELQGRMIAAQAQLEGLRSIYTDNSVRVRALKAEIGRLQLEIQRMGGRAGTTADSETDQLYPSIRQLPLLGVTWADLYRRAKVQEAVFEALTKQFELAKVQEAKEIPSVKVLDEAKAPKKKSFPPRTVITIFGTGFAFCFAILWVLGNARWQAADPENPWKMFFQRVWNTLASPIKKRLVPHSGWARGAGKIIFRQSKNGDQQTDELVRKDEIR